MRSLMRSLAPTTFEDIAALVALYRPGPMGANMHTDYADRKNGRKPVVYYHADLEEILAPTYGLMIYQEQMMQVAQRMAGYSLAEADNLRKATGKKKRELIAKERSKFVAGCETAGYGAAFGEQMFDVIEPFADYSFNKSHSVGYGFVSYQTAYLKAHHPVEYLAALLTSVKDDKDKTAVYLNECRVLGIPVLVPDVNVAESDFVGKAGSIPFGMSAVRNVGEGIVAHIVAEREENGPFASFADFCNRVNPTVLNKRALESLIKAGAFDSLGHPRKGLLMVFERIADSALARRREAEAGIMSLFGEATVGGGPAEIDRVDIPDVEFDKMQRLAYEKEMLGLYVSDHPLMGAQQALSRHIESTLTEAKEMNDGAPTTLGGVVTALNRRYTKRGDLMATFVLEDLEAAMEVFVFPRTMADFGHLLEEDSVVAVKGRIDRRDDQAKFIAMEVKRPGAGDRGRPARPPEGARLPADGDPGGGGQADPRGPSRRLGGHAPRGGRAPRDGAAARPGVLRRRRERPPRRAARAPRRRRRLLARRRAFTSLDFHQRARPRQNDGPWMSTSAIRVPSSPPSWTNCRSFSGRRGAPSPRAPSTIRLNASAA